MALEGNPKHLAKLEEGVASWNQWREDNQDVRPNLIGANLKGANLSGADLEIADLSEADLSEADLGYAYLIGANLKGANLSEADLEIADLSYANLKGANLNRANLDGVNLSEADLRLANLRLANLIGANLREANLSNAYLRGANLSRVNLSRVNLINAQLSGTDLSGANLNGVDLSRADLSRATLMGASLKGANLSEAHMRGANLREADLNRASLSKADLSEADLSKAILSRADLSEAVLDETVFAAVNLSETEGLDSCRHQGPSIIDHRTLAKSSALPIVFLHGVGLLNWQIEAAKLHSPDLSPTEITNIVYEVDRLRSENPIQIHNLFISYTRDDSPFVEKLETYLKEHNILFWRDVHDAIAGRLEKVVVRAMRDRTVLLILSGLSVESDWVQFEAQNARNIEKELRKEGIERDVLCPIALDDAWKTSYWSGPLRNQIEQYNVLDFSEWKDAARLQNAFKKLVAGLDLFYK